MPSDLKMLSPVTTPLTDYTGHIVQANLSAFLLVDQLSVTLTFSSLKQTIMLLNILQHHLLSINRETNVGLS